MADNSGDGTHETTKVCRCRELALGSYLLVLRQTALLFPRTSFQNNAPMMPPLNFQVNISSSPSPSSTSLLLIFSIFRPSSEWPFSACLPGCLLPPALRCQRIHGYFLFYENCDRFVRRSLKEPISSSSSSSSEWRPAGPPSKLALNERASERVRRLLLLLPPSVAAAAASIQSDCLIARLSAPSLSLPLASSAALQALTSSLFVPLHFLILKR